MTEMDLKKIIGMNIRFFREKKNLTQYQFSLFLSKDLFYKSKTIVKKIKTWENGIQSPSLKTLIIICKALNVSLNAIFFSLKNEDNHKLEMPLEDILKTIAENVSYYRTKKNMSQSKLGKEIAQITARENIISQTIISLIERDELIPSIELFYIFCKYFKISPSEMCEKHKEYDKELFF